MLSACETARGRGGGGEGLIGMTWALFIAGSASTVTTSWKVDSGSAARFGLNPSRFTPGSAEVRGDAPGRARLDESARVQPSLLLEWFFHARAGF